MAENSDSKSDDVGFVIVSFAVVTAVPVEGLARYLRESRVESDEFVYGLGTETFEEPETHARADKLDATINGFLDLTVSIPREVFHDPKAFVRLYLTFGRGAETVSAKTLQRLADVNATLWIDA